MIRDSAALLELLRLVLVLGLPVALLTAALFVRLFEGGALPRDASRRELDDERTLRRHAKADGVTRRLARYCGGFYGITALWTLVVAECADLWRLLVALPELPMSLSAGFGAMVSAFVANQVSNLITAFTWFAYWSDGRVFWTLAIAFLGHRTGQAFARVMDTATLRERARRLWGERS